MRWEVIEVFSLAARSPAVRGGALVLTLPCILNRAMKRSLTIALTVLAMLLVAALTAMLSLRVAIHGREVVVPDFSGLSDADAVAAAHRLGINMSVENRFYSAAVASNHVLSQAPAPGARVRRGWQVRVTESLGGQHVAAPDVTGEGERPALLMLSRLQLTLAPEAHLPTSGPPGIVLAQSPPPNVADAAGPQVSLLVSGAQSDPSTFAYVMPRLTGMRADAASSLLATAGLSLPRAADPEAPGTSSASPQNSQPDPAIAPIVHPSAGEPQPVAAPKPDVSIPISARPGMNPAAIITSQSPQPGQRVTRTDVIHVGFGSTASSSITDPLP